MSDYIHIMLAVNDPDNGIETGYVRAIDFDDLLSVWAYDPVMTCRCVGNDKLRLGRRVFPIQGYTTWVGNWCWDAVSVDIETANAIAEHIRKSGKFSPEQGVIEVWDAWDNGQPIDLRIADAD